MGGRGFEAGSQAREHRVRIVAFAVHQLVHTTLQTVAQRLEHDGGESRGDQRDDQAPLHLQHRAKPTYHQHVENDYAGGQDAVDEGAVDDEVYVEEVVAQDCDTYGEGDEEHERVGDRLPGQVREQCAR